MDTFEMQGVTNFAIFSSNATGVILCLFAEPDLVAGRITHSIRLDPLFNRTGDVWHIALPELNPSLFYGYVFEGANSKMNEDYPGQAFDTVRPGNCCVCPFRF